MQRASEDPYTAPTRREPLVLLITAAILLVLSGISPTDRLTWYLEVAPVAIGIVVLPLTWRRFPMTPLLCRLLFIHGAILLLGGHYTYAQVPLGFWFQDLFDLSRNHYDRLGHLAQGFVPAILAREILIRRSPVRGTRWLPLFVTSVCLAFSAFFELFEWWVALLLGMDADAFLATQGDPWDTQWDMFLALIGALAAQLSLARLHDRQIERLENAPA